MSWMLSAFTMVEKAIHDDVKKNDYCTEAIQSNTKDIAKADDLMAELKPRLMFLVRRRS